MNKIDIFTFIFDTIQPFSVSPKETGMIFTNLALLPHDESIIIKDITQKIHYLQLMKILLHQVHCSIKCFENKRLNYFDAQVGETLCQIRAYKIYTLALSKHFQILIPRLKQEIEPILEKLDNHINQYQIFLKLNKTQRSEEVRAQVTLINFFKNLDCIVQISDDAIFVFLSYFLCIYHQVDEKEIPVAIDFLEISSSLNLSRSYAKKLGRFYQKILSELSCKFIFDLLNDLDNLEQLKLVIPWLYLQSDEGRMVLPCYPVTEIIVRHMIKNNANLILLIDFSNKKRKALYFKGSCKMNEFELRPMPEQNKPCVVMYGSCESDESTLKRFLSIGLKEVILANNAFHPQYSGTTLAAYSYDPFETLVQNYKNQLSYETCILNHLSTQLLQKKKQAEKIGCCINNKKLFLLKHIYCNTLKFYNNSELFVTQKCLFKSIKNQKESVYNQ